MRNEIAKFICESIGVPIRDESTDLQAVFAVDNRKTSSYSIQRIKDELSEEQLSILYHDLIMSWLLGCASLTNFDWGWIEDGEDIKPLPFKLKEPFSNFYGDQKYRYGILQANPETMLHVHTDMLYCKQLYALYKKIISMLDDIVVDITNKFQSDILTVSHCLDMFIDNVTYLENLFSTSGYVSRGILDKIKLIDQEFYLRAKGNYDISGIYSPEQISAILDKVFEWEEADYESN